MKFMKKNGGFTLVELIVVIAILAILAGVAVPAYSGYVEKANKGADVALVSEIEHALVMAYYANPSEFKGGTIVSVSCGAPAKAEDSFARTAMVAAFGDAWEQGAQLKYDGWKSENVEGSRFQGIETDLLERVDYLTTSLQEPLNAFAGENFQKFMADNGIDSSDKKTVSNAAVLYVANNTANLNDAQQQKIIDIFTGAMTSGSSKNVLANITEVCNGDMVTAAASMYAIATAYSEHSGLPFNVEFNANETPETAGSKIYNAFNSLAQKDMAKTKEYLETGLVNQDIKAYMDILSTVNNAKGQVVGNLGNLGGEGGPTWTSTYNDLFTSYNNGGVFVFLELDENGAPVAGSTLVEN